MVIVLILRQLVPQLEVEVCHLIRQIRETRDAFFWGEENAMLTMYRPHFKNLINVPINLNGLIETFAVVHTGAEMNVISSSLFDELSCDLIPYSSVFRSADYSLILPVGKARFEISCLGSETVAEAVVLKSDYKYFLSGVPLLLKLKLDISFSSKEIVCC